MSDLRCPGCERDDQTQRVTSIVEAGTWTGVYSGTRCPQFASQGVAMVFTGTRQFKH
jgi:hypothetical protein